MEKVFCSRCKNFDDVHGREYCNAYSNLKGYYSEVRDCYTGILTPEEKNRNNDCEDFKPTLFHKLATFFKKKNKPSGKK